MINPRNKPLSERYSHSTMDFGSKRYPDVCCRDAGQRKWYFLSRAGKILADRPLNGGTFYIMLSGIRIRFSFSPWLVLYDSLMEPENAVYHPTIQNRLMQTPSQRFLLNNA